MNRSDPLLTDQYTLTMAQSFWKAGIGEEETVFDLFVRRLPKHRNYLIAAGLEPAFEYLENFEFLDVDIDFLRSLEIYEEGFLKYLKNLRFTGSVRAVGEGTPIPAQAPILSIKAPRIQASIVESVLLAIVNHQTMIASKTARIVSAARGCEIWDFSLRRLHGPEASLGVARASYIAGAAGTATVAAGREYGIPTSGTMAHHYVQSFGPDNEQEAFERFLSDYPAKNTLLVDTYDTLRGVKRAVQASQKTGVALGGIRLDSGDMVELAIGAREILNYAGMPDTKIFASNDLDEYSIKDMLDRGAPIDAFGVGTMLGTSADAPNLGGVYKLVSQSVSDATEFVRPMLVMKSAMNKQTDPGEHQVWRKGSRYVLGLYDEDFPKDGFHLLAEKMRDGVRVGDVHSLKDMRGYCQYALEGLPDEVLSIEEDCPLEIERTDKLLELRETLTKNNIG